MEAVLEPINTRTAELVASESVFTKALNLCAPQLDEVAFQALVYRELAHLLRYPDRCLCESISRLTELFVEGSKERILLENMASALEGCTSLDLERDYTALFIGALEMKAVPFASYYLDGKRQLNGPSTLSIEKLYAEWGLTHTPKRRQPADHIATMLEYLYAMLTNATELLKQNVDDVRNMQLGKPQNAAFVQACKRLEEANTFFVRYLRPWVCTFARSVVKGAQTEFYGSLGKILPVILIDDSLMDGFVH